MDFNFQTIYGLRTLAGVRFVQYGIRLSAQVYGMTLEKVRGRGVALLYAFALAGCTAAHASGKPTAPGVYAMSFGRLGAIAAALVALTGVVIGGLALARSASRLSTGNGRSRAIMAMVAGLIGMALGGLVVVTSNGGVGTGKGVGGAIVAVVIGLIGTVIGGVALARSRRTG
jgi:hypothetical protein